MNNIKNEARLIFSIIQWNSFGNKEEKHYFCK